MRHLASRFSVGSLVLLAASIADADPTVAAQTGVHAGPVSQITLTIQDGYELVELGTANGRNSYATAISPNGKVAGADRQGANGNTRAALWSNPPAAPSYPANNDWSAAVGFTPGGEVVGYRLQDLYQGFRGNTTLGDFYRVPYGISPSGKMVGIKPSQDNKHWVAYATSDNLKTVSGFTDSYAVDMSSQGAAVGWASNGASTPTRAVRWSENGTPTMLPGKSADHPHGQANAINDKNVIVGSVGDGDSARAVRWDNEQLTELTGLGGKSEAYAINGNGSIIVGQSADADGDLHGVVFRNNKAVDLNTLIDRPEIAKRVAVASSAAKMTVTDRVNLLAADWFVQAATCINDKGEIGGYAVKLGVVHAVVMKPVFKTVTVVSGAEVKDGMKNAKPPRTRMSFKEHAPTPPPPPKK